MSKINKLNYTPLLFFFLSFLIYGLMTITSCDSTKEDHLFINQALIQPSDDGYSWKIDFLSEKQHIQFSLLKVRLEKEEENVIRFEEFNLLDHQVFNISLEKEQNASDKYSGSVALEMDLNAKQKKANLIINAKKHPSNILSYDFRSSSRRSEKWIEDLYSPVILMNAHLLNEEKTEEFVFLQFIPCKNPDSKSFNEIYMNKKLMHEGYVLGGRGFENLLGFKGPFKDL